MKQWTKDIEIDAPIEQVWQYFGGSLDNMQKIMPQVLEHTPVEITEEGVGSIYSQKYKEGNRIEAYDVETLEYADSPAAKKLKVGFTLANMFEITALYELKQISDDRTFFRYTVTNRPLKWFINLVLFFANDKVVKQFVEKVKSVAETEHQQIHN